MVQLRTAFVVAALSYYLFGRQSCFFPSHNWRF
jgi:hypothetical protein